MTLGEALDAVPPRATLSLPEGSWGEGGDHRVWLNPEHRVDVGSGLQRRGRVGRPPRPARRPGRPRDLRRVLTQATRELLLLQSSDWQFLITTGTASDYAERRIAEHYAEFKRLGEMARALEAGDFLSPDAVDTLRRLEREDFCFPDLDPALGSGPAHIALSPMPRRARVLAMIMAGGRGDRLQPLTRERSKSAVPFGGRHRLIDFVLSNFVNSDMPSLYVLVQYKAQSLIEHLRLAWRTSGMLPDFFVTVVPPQMRVGAAWYRGTADAVLQNLNLIDDFSADVVAVFGSDHVYRMDVNQMLAFHQESGADATIAARPVPIDDARQFGVLGVDHTGRVVRFDEKPATPGAAAGRSRAGARLDGQLHLLAPAARRRARGRRAALHRSRLRPLDHPRDGPGRAGLRLRLPAQRGAGREALRGARVLARRRHHRRATGRPTWTSWASPRASISTIGCWPIRNAHHAGPAARFVGGDVDNAQIGEASLVKRATIRNSILGRSVWVNEGAVIEDSIVMDHTTVGQGRPSPSRHHRPIQHHPGRRRDRVRPGRRSAHVSRRRVGAGRGAPRRAPRVPPGPGRLLNRAIVIHGHFYQPPRENPWLEAVEVQDSAAPYHDWNERVTAECYAPNTAARRVDEQNRVARHRQQLREDLVQRRADAPGLARAPPARRVREDPRGRPRERRGARRARQRAARRSTTT